MTDLMEAVVSDAAHAYEVRRDGYAVSCDPARLDVDYVFDFLSTTYWNAGITRDRLERSIAHSINFGLYHVEDAAGGEGGRQIGFARVMGDRTNVAHLADVFVDARYRGRGLGHWLMVAVHDHPELQGLTRWTLKTSDAHRLYQRFGYEMLGGEGGLMVRTP